MVDSCTWSSTSGSKPSLPCRQRECYSSCIITSTTGAPAPQQGITENEVQVTRIQEEELGESEKLIAPTAVGANFRPAGRAGYTNTPI